jgi:23S rRNA G2069 N7-methylase RlmK/C1962 C5-methylase RlmI
MASDLDYQVEIFTNRLKKRFKHLGKWARRNGITCYRVYDRDIPEVPLAVDLYGTYVHVSEYYSPHKDLPGPAERYSAAMLDAARRALGIQEDRAFYKQRRVTARGEQYERQEVDPVWAEVEESGLRFRVNFTQYLDTGLFLDHRVSRTMVADLVSELAAATPVNMLNLFSYTGSFSVYAASAGALFTTSVDMSNTYSSWAAENLALNGFSPPHHRTVVEDVFSFLQAEARHDTRYQVIVLDPPTFSNSKKMERTLDTQRDHGELLAACESVLAPGGLIFFSTNKRKFKLDNLPRGLSATDITQMTIPEDFRNQRIHQAYLVERAR